MENMKESREMLPEWIRPNIEKERGEIKRVVSDFLSQEPNAENIETVIQLLENSPLTELSDEEWAMLENTDSFHNVSAGDIAGAERINEEYNQELLPENKRDFASLLEAFQNGNNMEAPTILKANGVLHLVSGNTRLMIARALNIRPKVIIGEIN
jgi:hypothetical protein